MHGSHALPIRRPGLMVSLARSGDSPESVGALALMLKIEPKIRHLVLTCNRQAKLATTFQDNPKVTAITLDELTNDKSLGMTSSFTNLCWPRAPWACWDIQIAIRRSVNI